MKNLNKSLIFTVLAFFAFSIVFLNSCILDDDDEIPPSAYAGVFIINEGSFNKGNSSVSFYNPSGSALTENLFTKVNSRPLGDIFQSMAKVGDNFYLVVNNSSKIEVVNATDFKSVATISGLGSPRFFLSPSSSNGTKAYVTDLFNNQIHVLDLKTNTKIKSISLGGWSEHMVEAGGNVYANNWTNKKVYVIDPTADVVKDSIVLSAAPNGIVIDANKKIWILLDTSGNQKAKLIRINPANNTIEVTVEFSAGGYGAKLAINGAGDKLYFTNSNGLYEMDITATTVPATPKKAGNFYSLGVDPIDGTIYLGDALDFNQKGNITRINGDGSETAFKAGIIPGNFFFNR